jgi:hypothetical protein
VRTVERKTRRGGRGALGALSNHDGRPAVVVDVDVDVDGDGDVVVAVGHLLGDHVRGAPGAHRHVAPA